MMSKKCKTDKQDKANFDTNSKNNVWLAYFTNGKI